MTLFKTSEQKAKSQADIRPLSVADVILVSGGAGGLVAGVFLNPQPLPPRHAPVTTW